MSNTSMALKGSKLRMQQVANNKNLTEYFSHLLGETEPVIFLSPLASEDFKEYKLKELGNCKNKLYANIFEKVDWKLGNFEWNKNQPLWDGVAISRDRKRLYIVEAKSYAKEMISQGCRAKSVAEKGNRENIEGMLHYVFENYGCKRGQADWNVWLKDYYQLANRYTFLQILRSQIHNLNGVKKVKLVLLNFLDDQTTQAIPTDLPTWKNDYEIVLRKVLGKSSTNIKNDEEVKLIFMNIEWGKAGEKQVEKRKIKEDLLWAIDKYGDNFYRSDIMTYRGITSDDYRWASDYLAELLLADHSDLLVKDRQISRQSSYNMSKTEHDCKSLNNESNREEHKISLRMRQKGYLEGVGQVLDYQIPLNDKKNDAAGAVDLLAYNETLNELYILELKRPDSDESLVRCITEIEAYYRTIDKRKLKTDFNKLNAKIVKGILLFPSLKCRAYREYIEANYGNECPKINDLMLKLKQQVFIVKEKNEFL